MQQCAAEHDLSLCPTLPRGAVTRPCRTPHYIVSLRRFCVVAQGALQPFCRVLGRAVPQGDGDLPLAKAVPGALRHAYNAKQRAVAAWLA